MLPAKDSPRLEHEQHDDLVRRQHHSAAAGEVRWGQPLEWFSVGVRSEGRILFFSIDRLTETQHERLSVQLAGHGGGGHVPPPPPPQTASPLAPKESPRLGLEQRLPEELLVRLGLKAKGEATPEYVQIQLFEAATACSETDTLSKAMFMAYAHQHWSSFDHFMASAAFDAGDIDGSGRINRHEFALLVRTFLNGRPGDEAMPELVTLCRDAQAKYETERAKRDVSEVVLDPRTVMAAGNVGGAPTMNRVRTAVVGTNAVNDAFVLDDAMRVLEGADWRGALAAPQGSAVHALAPGSWTRGGG